LRLNPTYTPFQIAIDIIAMFNIKAEEDVTAMFKLFPAKIRRDIKKDAQRFYKEVTIQEKDDDEI